MTFIFFSFLDRHSRREEDEISHLKKNTMASVVVDEASSTTSKSVTPNDFVHSIVGKSVIVKLNSGITYHGVLACLDGFMNLALESCEEYVDGQRTKSFGDCFIRGNNVLYLSAKK